MTPIRKTFILSLLFVLPLLATELNAQTNTLGEFNKHVIEKWSNDYIRISRYRVKGSPFLLGEAFPGNITYIDGSEMKKINVLYNIYEQKAGMEVGKEMVQPGIVIKQFVMQLPEKFGSELLLFKPASGYDPKMEGYLNVLAEGPKASLLKAYRAKLVADPSNMYANDIKMIEQYAEYYIHLTGSKELVKVKLRDKELIKALGGGENLKEYLVAEKLDVAREKDAAKLLHYLNSL
jgi:hypothetical protein